MFLRGPERPGVELYGKLPIAKDYLRVGLGKEGGLALREWLDTTYSSARGPGETLGLAGALRFVIGDAWGASHQGVLWPSTDAGGHRAFPFLVAVERRRKALRADVAFGYPQANVVWRELMAVRDIALSRVDGREALAALRGRVVDVPSPIERAHGGADLERWLEALWGPEGRKGLEADLDRLRRAADRATIRLPLAREMSLRGQVAAWCWALERLGVASSRQVSTHFFPLDSSAAPRPFLTIFRGGASPGDAAWLAEVRPDEPLGPLDLAARPMHEVRSAPPDGGGAPPPLTDSLRALVASYLASSGG